MKIVCSIILSGGFCDRIFFILNIANPAIILFLTLANKMTKRIVRLCILACLVIIQFLKCGGFVWLSGTTKGIVSGAPRRLPTVAQIAVPKRVRNDNLFGLNNVKNDKGVIL